MTDRGEAVILVRLETSPEDIEGMHACGGHSDRPRRHDLPRGRCRPRHGHLLCLRLRRDQASTRRQRYSSLGGYEYPRGRLRFRWTARPARSTTGLHPDAGRRRSAATSAASWAGRTSSAACRSARTPTTPERHRRMRFVWAPRASVCAVPSTCSSSRSASRRSAKMILSRHRAEQR